MAKYDLTELGRTGLKQYSGYIQEEFLRELQGERWRRVIKQMIDNDPTIGAILYAIQMRIRQVEWDIRPASESQEDVDNAEFVDECLKDMSSSWADTLSEILSFLPWGWSYLELVYKVRGGMDTDDPAKRSVFNDGKIGWRKWAIRSQD